MSCLSTNQLVKKYKKAEVVRGVSIQINEGEIVGLLGPNGWDSGPRTPTERSGPEFRSLTAHAAHPARHVLPALGRR